jgi:FMN phosphatase YigB (HAD superfamily)
MIFFDIDETLLDNSAAGMKGIWLNRNGLKLRAGIMTIESLSDVMDKI